MEFERNGQHRVVVTGIGAVTPLGTAKEMWNALLQGTSGIKRIQTEALGHVPVQIGGEIRDFDPTQFVSKKDARRMARVSQFAVAAAEMAAEDAYLIPDDIERNGESAGVVMGTTMGPHLLAESMTSTYRANGHQRPNPVSFANCLPNMPAHYVSKHLRTFGPLHTPIAACATGTQAIGIATDLIRTGRAELVFAGGAEAIIKDYIFAGFASMSALAEGYEDCPEHASRPFDAARSGFVLSEGSGVLVLESLKHAMQRDARIYVEVLGHASSSDAYHIAVIDPDAKRNATLYAMGTPECEDQS